MHGLIGKMTAVSGQRDALVSILLEGIPGMAGCLGHVVAHDCARLGPGAAIMTHITDDVIATAVDRRLQNAFVGVRRFSFP